MKPKNPKPAPPVDEAELLARVRAIAARTVGELGEVAGTHVPPSTHRAKGFVGQLMEHVLGASAGSRDDPDFLEIGVELKTLPIVGGKPKESTFVTTINLLDVPDTDFEDSSVARKLARVLWLPVQADRDLPLPERRVGSGVLWSPSEAQAKVLRADWDHIADLVVAGEVDRVTGHLGEALQVRPKAADGSVRMRAPDGDGGFRWTGPRGFYLRPSFTHQIIAGLA